MMETKSLPEEVVIEILSRLSAKDLIRSRCVCKAWLKLLTPDSHFHKLHLHRLTNNQLNPNPLIMLTHSERNSLHLASCTESDEAAAVEIQFPFTISSPKVFGICNGLVCLASSSKETLPNVYIWNPLTKDHVTIPCSPIPSQTTSNTFGFGFCTITQAFKVIRILTTNIFEMEFGFQSNFSVFTLGTNSWRSLGSIPNDVKIFEHSTALVNNTLHWFAASAGSFVWNLVVSFNMNTETFQEIPHPVGIDYDYPNHVTIGELGGLLCIYCALCNEFIEIWVMKEYGVVDSWTKQFRFGRPEASGLFYFLRPLGLADGGEIIMTENGGTIILYNSRTNSGRRLKKFGFEYHNAYYYTGSILSPRLVNGVNISPI